MTEQTETQPRPFYCSFCGKPHTEVEVLVAAHEGLMICEFCVGLCIDIINQHRLERNSQELSSFEKDVNTPDEPT